MEWRTFNVNATRDGVWLQAPGPHPMPEVPGAFVEASAGARDSQDACDSQETVRDSQDLAEAPASPDAGEAKRRKVEAVTPRAGISPSTFQQGSALQVDIPVLMNIRQVSAGQELRYYNTPKPAKVDGKAKTKAKALKVNLSGMF